MGCKSFHNGNPHNHEGVSNTWFTPKKIVKVLGDFDLDPCTQSFRPFDTAKKHICEDLGECGLSAKWVGRVWLNPPYGKEIGKWLSLLGLHGNGIALVFSRTETRWAQKAISECDAVFFIKGRISFMRADHSKYSSAANGNMFLIYGQDNIKAVKESEIEGIMFENTWNLL